MNDEIILLYDTYVTIKETEAFTVQFKGVYNTTKVKANHVRHLKAGCYIYSRCYNCEFLVVNELILGMVFCKYNLKPERMIFEHFISCLKCDKFCLKKDDNQ